LNKNPKKLKESLFSGTFGHRKFQKKKKKKSKKKTVKKKRERESINVCNVGLEEWRRLRRKEVYMGGGGTLVHAIRRFIHRTISINSHHNNANHPLHSNNDSNNIKNDPSSLNLLKVPTRSLFIPSVMDRLKKVPFLCFLVQSGLTLLVF